MSTSSRQLQDFGFLKAIYIGAIGSDNAVCLVHSSIFILLNAVQNVPVLP